MTSPKAHKLCFSLSKERRNGGSVIFPPSEMWKHIGRSHLTKIPNCAHVNFTATLDKVFSPSPLLNCGGIISRSVVYAGKSWKNKRKQRGAWFDTTSTFKTQTKTPCSRSCSIWNEWKKNRLSSNFHPVFKSSIHISLGNSLQMIYRICEIQL